MKYTAKYLAAGKVYRQLALDLGPRPDNETVYDALEKAGWYWNSKLGEWENLKRSNSMFKNDDGEPTGVIRLRLMAHPGDMDKFMELIAEALDSYGIKVIDESNLYPNRRGAGIRVYLTATLPTEVKKKPAKTKKAKPATDDDPYHGHKGFFADVDGEPIHVLGDPNMSEETLNALKTMARAARRMQDDQNDESERQ